MRASSRLMACTAARGMRSPSAPSESTVRGVETGGAGASPAPEVVRTNPPEWIAHFTTLSAVGYGVVAAAAGAGERNGLARWGHNAQRTRRPRGKGRTGKT